MIAFVDFDNTLCLHAKSINTEKYAKGGTPYHNSIPNIFLINYLHNLKNKGFKIVLLTMSSSFMLKHKIEYCEKNCPGLFDDFISLSIDCPKYLYIKEFLCEYKDIVFIDDSQKERSSVEELKNVKVYSPQYLQNINIFQ